MPRIPNVRPTSIYWLYDVRPETLVKWPNGLPFYCGKTVLSIAARFSKHRSDARKHPNKGLPQRLLACGECVVVRIMEVVPISVNWAEREKFWVYTIRTLYPNTVNITAGGQGAPGHVPSAETRAKRSAALKGRVFSAEHRARIGAASSNRSAETRAKLSVWQKGKSFPNRAKGGLALKGKKKNLSAESRARMGQAARNRSPEVYARIGAKLKGRVFSAETLARMGAAQRRRYQRLRSASA